MSGEKLKRWEQKLKNEELNFVSYRICDGTRFAFQKVNSLIKDRKVVFWDRWSLPRRLAERRELVADKFLDKYIMEQLDQSSVVWGIESKNYSVEGSYSAKEQFRARNLKKYRTVLAD